MRKRSRRLTSPSPTLSTGMERSTLTQQETLQRQEDQLDVMASLSRAPSLQTQRERADRLGHHFGRVSVLSSTPQLMGQRASGDPFVQRLESTEESQIMQESETDAPEAERSGADLEGQLSTAKGGGSPLPEETRRFMEPRFGADFSGVRIHTGGEAVQMNRSLSAQAFTHGSDIFFNSGKFDPQSQPGKQLLAHELTHVLQQSGSGRISAKGMDETMPTPEQEHQAQDPQKAEDEGQTAQGKDRSRKAPGMEVEDEIDRVAQEYVPPREAFMREDLFGVFNETPNVRGEVGDCHELAKMRAVAQKSPEEIKKRVQDNYDGTYNITIYIRDPNTDQKLPLTQMVDGILPVGQPGRDFFSSEQMVSPPEPEFWAMLVEKAYAMHVRGLGQVEGGTISRSLQMLTGMSEFPIDRFSDKQITSILSYTTNHRAEVSATSQNFTGKTQEAQDEAQRRGLPLSSRSNFKIDRANGSIIIQNPYGNTLNLSMERFRHFFTSFTVR